MVGTIRYYCLDRGQGNLENNVGSVRSPFLSKNEEFLTGYLRIKIKATDQPFVGVICIVGTIRSIILFGQGQRR